MKKSASLGFAMLEVLLSISVIALVLFSLLIYQINLNQDITKIHFQAIALFQLENFSEMLLANRDKKYRRDALTTWNKVNAHLLPQGQGYFQTSDDHHCSITIEWFFRKTENQRMMVFC